MKALTIVVLSFVISTSAFAMASAPKDCEAKWGDPSDPNYDFQFAPARSGGAWNFDGTYNYRFDANGNRIANPVGKRTFDNGGRTVLCNGTPITEYGVVCNDPSKVNYNEPAWLECRK